jgi:Tol biopolymer transport system component
VGDFQQGLPVTGWGIANDVHDAGAIERLTSQLPSQQAYYEFSNLTSIAFLRKPRDSGASSIYIVPATGGPERKIVDLSLPRYHDFSVLTWTPDGKWLIAPARETENDPIGLFRISPDDGSKIRLTRPPPDQTDFDPAISPNGRMMAFTGSSSDGVFSIYLQPLSANFLAAGEPKALPCFPDLHVGTPQWTPDGKELVFVANPKVGMAIWRMRVPESGEAAQSPRREMFAALSSDMKIGRISAAARRLMYSTELQETNVWRVPLQASGPLPVLQRMGPAGLRNSGARISPDGSRVVFESLRTGSTEIWVSDAGGSNPKQLTNDGGPVTGSPAWSPDGRRIAFDSRAEGRPHIYVIPAAGGRAERITDALAENYVPSWSRDGRWIYFSSNRSGQVEVWRQPAAGGAAKQITQARGRAPMESPDGAAVYYERLRSGGYMLRRLTFATGEDVEVLPAIVDRNFELTPTGIYYVPVPGPDGRFTIQFYDLRSGVSRLITPISKPMTRALSLSPDGAFLLYSQFDRWGHNLMLVEGFR